MRNSDQRSRWAPHELAMVALGFVVPLGAETKPAFLSYDNVKIGIVAITVYLLGLAIFSAKGRTDLRPEVRRSAVPLTVLFAAYGISSLTWQLMPSRWYLYLTLIVGVIGYFICEALRPGSFLDIAYRVSFLHIVLALVAGQTHVVASGATRLAGATSAVLLGFEATLVFVIALSRWATRTGRWPALSLVIAVIMPYVVYAAFSRAAIISLVAGLAALAIYRLRTHRGLLSILLGGFTIVGYLLFESQIREFLGGNDQASLSNASGRYVIWQRLIENNEHWFRGYGFAALRWPDQPEATLSFINQGLSAENAILQATIMGSLVAGIAWLLLAVRSLQVLWSVRSQLKGTSIFIAIVLLVNMIYSAGLSGVSSQMWWMLAAFSLPAWYGQLNSEKGKARRDSYAPAL